MSESPKLWDAFAKKVRQPFADWLIGDGAFEGAHGDAGHAPVAKRLTERMNSAGLSPEQAATMTRYAGFANEALPYAMRAIQADSQLLAGEKPEAMGEMVSPTGFDPDDLRDNEIGIQQALEGDDDRDPTYAAFMDTMSSHPAVGPQGALLAAGASGASRLADKIRSIMGRLR